MKKIYSFFLFLLFFLITAIYHPQKIHAATECTDVEIKAVGEDGKIYFDKDEFPENIKQIEYTIKFNQKGIYKIYGDNGVFICLDAGCGVKFYKDYQYIITTPTDELKGTINRNFQVVGVSTQNSGQFDQGSHRLNLEIKTDFGWDKVDTESCKIDYKVTSAPLKTEENCSIKVDPPAEITSNTPVTISVSSKYDLNDPYIGAGITIGRKSDGKEVYYRGMSKIAKTFQDNFYTAKFEADFTCPEYSTEPCQNIKLLCNAQFSVCDKGCGWVTPTPTLTPTPTDAPQCYDGTCSPKKCTTDSSCSGCSFCKAKTARPDVKLPSLAPLCDQLANQFRAKCWECINSSGVWSAIGCLPTDFSELIKKYVFTTGVGIAGGIAFIYFLYGAFMILTSSGNAEKMEEAKQIITSALAGLLLIIFSVFLLSVIGVQILQLPGFG